jgi:hypothetical protein
VLAYKKIEGLHWEEGLAAMGISVPGGGIKIKA